MRTNDGHPCPYLGPLIRDFLSLTLRAHFVRLKRQSCRFIIHEGKTIFWLLALSMLIFTSAEAWTWKDLWLREDQQALHNLKHHKPHLAAQQFRDPLWRAVAEYRAGKYSESIHALSGQNQADAHYNRGNALAQLGKNKAAIEAYEQALHLEPNHEDAKFNLELLKKNEDSSSSSSSSSSNQQSAEKPSSPPPPSSESKAGEKEEKKLSQTPQPKAQGATDWLSQIPDDPGGLLRRKFLRDHALRLASKHK